MKNEYGIYEVRTENDCEGRSTKSLGVYEGFPKDIAYHLRDAVYYNLYIQGSKLEKVRSGNIPDGIEIRLSGSGVVTITDKRAEREKAREKALTKLTQTEKQLLGL